MCLTSRSFLKFLKYVYLSLLDRFSPWGVAFLKQPRVAYVVKKMSAFLESRFLRSRLIRDCQRALNCATGIHATSVTPCFSKISFNIVPLSISLAFVTSPNSWLPLCFFQEILYLRPLMQQTEYGRIWYLIWGHRIGICVNSKVSIPLCIYRSEGYVILSPTQVIIYLLLILADRQHVSALFKSPSSGLPV
jgi:hypothetical protein